LNLEKGEKVKGKHMKREKSVMLLREKGEGATLKKIRTRVETG